jgi:copper chaperone CopZ
VCAHAVRVAIRKLPGVEAVDVSLERALADIRLRPGNTVTLPQLRQIIKNNGFTAKDATITVVGTIIERGGQPAINVTGTDIVMRLVADARATAAFKQVQDRMRTKHATPVQITGLAESRGDQPDQIVVRDVEGLDR